MGYQGYIYWWKLLDLLFPPQCVGCGKWGERFCRTCIQKVKKIQNPICQSCGDPLSDRTWILCERCQVEKPSYNAIRSWAVYEGVLRNAVLHLKYNQDLGLGTELSILLEDLLKTQSWEVDLVTAVPLDAKRLKDRGYNQVELLAKPLAYKRGLEFSKTAIRRDRSTRSQVGLTFRDRLENVRDAFLADSNIVAGKSILIIDDVVTTGATINSCSSALIKANAKKVWGLTLARASRLQGE